jgi:hypothetical protein
VAGCKTESDSTCHLSSQIVNTLETPEYRPAAFSAASSVAEVALPRYASTLASLDLFNVCALRRLRTSIVSEVSPRSAVVGATGGGGVGALRCKCAETLRGERRFG